MSIEKLDKAYKKYLDDVFSSANLSSANSAFLIFAIGEIREILKSQSATIAGQEKRIKDLEQAKTFFPMAENKHRALLNNCVDDDKAILYKREIGKLEE